MGVVHGKCVGVACEHVVIIDFLFYVQHRLLLVIELAQSLQLLYLRRLWRSSNSRYINISRPHNTGNLSSTQFHSYSCSLHISQDLPLSPQSISTSPLLAPLLFTDWISCVYAHLDHYILPLPCAVDRDFNVIHSSDAGNGSAVINSYAKLPRQKRIMRCVATQMPKFLTAFMPQVFNTINVDIFDLLLKECTCVFENMAVCVCFIVTTSIGRN